MHRCFARVRDQLSHREALGRLRQQRRHDMTVDLDKIEVPLPVRYRLIKDLAHSRPCSGERGASGQQNVAETDNRDWNLHRARNSC
jgi:hypothetical protein